MKSLQGSYTPGHETAVVLAMVLAAGIAAVLSLCLGAVRLTPEELVRALLEGTQGVAGRIFWFVRLPRTLAALLTGAALAVSGVAIQTVLHNPLAAPNIIGVNAGAGFAVALAAVFFPGSLGEIPWLSFLGAITAAAVVLAISRLTGASKITLVLGGVMISSLFNAAIDALLTFQPDALTGYADFRVGSFRDITMARVENVVLPLTVALAGILLAAPALEILSLGDETAASLGLSVRPVRMVLLFLAAVLAGAAVSLAGIIGFVGLIVPHFIRRLTGEKLLPLLLASAFGGAAFVAFCDTAARTLFAPYELPVGVVLSFLGVPVFLWQLLRSRRRRG
ncbi:MAG: iron ABC transporter permease [Oscillospiraceae bacterium]|nr:iron ABC transporter permease [Oscillospiraceae bacterium]